MKLKYPFKNSIEGKWGAILKRAGTEDRNQKTEYIENHWIKNENTTKKIAKYEMDTRTPNFELGGRLEYLKYLKFLKKKCFKSLNI